MTTAVGGSIESVSLKNRLFSVAADAEAERSLGGFTNEVQSDGDGGARLIKTRVPWSLSGLTLTVDEARADQKFLQDLADAKDYFNVTVTFASGAVYEGKGQIVDELNFNSSSTNCEIKLMGPKKLRKQ